MAIFKAVLCTTLGSVNYSSSKRVLAISDAIYHFTNFANNLLFTHYSHWKKHKLLLKHQSINKDLEIRDLK